MRTFQPRSLDGEETPPPDHGFRETVRWVISQAEDLAAGFTTLKGFHGGLIFSAAREELRGGTSPDDIRRELSVFARAVISNADLSWSMQEELWATIREMSEAAIEGRPTAPEYSVPIRERRIDRLWPMPL